MTIEKAIKLAIEGGWLLPYEGYMHEHPKDEKEECPFYLLDPLFWQALGKSLGWEKFDGEFVQGTHLWKENWHRLIDALSEGKTIEQFFAELK